MKENDSAVVFGYEVRDPQRYGVVGFNESGLVTSIQEKPEKPASNFAVVGLYFYPNDVINVSKSVKPSHRGELEITSVNQNYLSQNRLRVELMGRGYAWLDTGTQEAMNNASNFIKTIEDRQGLKVACLEEIAFNQGFIDRNKLEKLANSYKNDYGNYLKRILI